MRVFTQFRASGDDPKIWARSGLESSQATSPSADLNPPLYGPPARYCRSCSASLSPTVPTMLSSPTHVQMATGVSVKDDCVSLFNDVSPREGCPPMLSARTPALSQARARLLFPTAVLRSCPSLRTGLPEVLPGRVVRLRHQDRRHRRLGHLCTAPPTWPPGRSSAHRVAPGR